MAASEMCTTRMQPVCAEPAACNVGALGTIIVVCTDGAPAMLGCRSGFQTLVKQKSPNIVGCTIHRQALMVKTMPDEFKNVLNEVITAVNFIKSNALNSRLFSQLCRSE